MSHYYPSRGDRKDVLELCLEDILSLIKPSKTDLTKRLSTIDELTTYLGSLESLEGAVVRPFGSFTSNLYSKWGDLDISVELSSDLHSSASKNRKRYLLEKIMRVLQWNGVARNIQFIRNARVPLLKYDSNHHVISCDISIDNHMGQIKSEIFLGIASMDERFRDMVLLTKEWAKAQNINDPKSGTLNSFSLCLLVIFHFQTCEPAILPPLKRIYTGNIVDDIAERSYLTERHIKDVCAENISRFKSRGFSQRNQSSVSELLIAFLEKFSTIEDWSSEYAICTYTGRWERIRENPKWMEKPFGIFIEDPFEQPENAARAVSLNKLGIISHAFMDTNHKLSSRPMVSDRNSLIASLTRPQISSQLGVRTCVPYTANGVHNHRSGTGSLRYTTPEPIHDQFQNVLRPNRYRPSSSSTVTLQRPRTFNVQGQQTWRPRHPNRKWSTLELG